MRCHAGCDQERVIAALRSRGLWDGADRRPTRSRSRVAAADAKPDRDDAKRTEAALAIWQSATPATERRSRPISPRAACIFHRRRRSASMPG